MGQYSLPLPAATTNKMFSRWLSVINRRECASVISLPKFDRIYRANQFVSWYGEQHLDKTTLVPLSFQSLVTEIWSEIETKLNVLLNKKGQSVFLVTDADWLLSAAPHLIPHFASYVIGHSRNISFIFFFEHDILGQEYKALFESEPLFLQNLIYQPLYSHDDIIHFLHHMATIYQFKLSPVQAESIWQECGGYIWLATEALRHLHEHGVLNLTHLAFRYRLDSVWSGFTKSEQAALVQVVHNQPALTADITFFQKTGLLSDTTWPNCQIQVIHEYIKQISHSQYTLRLIGTEIMLGLRPITRVFSPQEREFVTALLNKPGVYLSREELAITLWGDSGIGEYSEWGLDQVVRRVRKRLTQIGLPPDLIHVIRSRGIRITI